MPPMVITSPTSGKKGITGHMMINARPRVNSTSTTSIPTSNRPIRTTAPIILENSRSKKACICAPGAASPAEICLNGSNKVFNSNPSEKKSIALLSFVPRPFTTRAQPLRYHQTYICAIIMVMIIPHPSL